MTLKVVRSNTRDLEYLGPIQNTALSEEIVFKNRSTINKLLKVSSWVAPERTPKLPPKLTLNTDNISTKNRPLLKKITHSEFKTNETRAITLTNNIVY